MGWYRRWHVSKFAKDEALLSVLSSGSTVNSLHETRARQYANGDFMEKSTFQNVLWQLYDALDIDWNHLMSCCHCGDFSIAFTMVLDRTAIGPLRKHAPTRERPIRKDGYRETKKKGMCGNELSFIAHHKLRELIEQFVKDGFESHEDFMRRLRDQRSYVEQYEGILRPELLRHCGIC